MIKFSYFMLALFFIGCDIKTSAYRDMDEYEKDTKTLRSNLDLCNNANNTIACEEASNNCIRMREKVDGGPKKYVLAMAFTYHDKCKEIIDKQNKINDIIFKNPNLLIEQISTIHKKYLLENKHIYIEGEISGFGMIRDEIELDLTTDSKKQVKVRMVNSNYNKNYKFKMYTNQLFVCEGGIELYGSGDSVKEEVILGSRVKIAPRTVLLKECSFQ